MKQLQRPLVIFEILSTGGRWDSDRSHRFVLQGMKENAGRLANSPAVYYPYVEPQAGECHRLLEAVFSHACAVTDERWIESTASRP